MSGDALEQALTDVWGDAAGLGAVRVTGPEHVLPSTFPVTAAATAVIASAARAAGRLQARRNGHDPDDAVVAIDTVHATLACRSERYLHAAAMPAVGDRLVGDYPAADGWIRIHTNYPHHRAAALGVLGVPADRDQFAAAVARRPGEELQEAVVAAGGAAATMRPAAEWDEHPHGRSVRARPLVSVEGHGSEPPAPRPARERPLEGVRVLDVTRVIAGPTAAKYLAAHGADVLRVEPPGFGETPLLTVDTGFGKRASTLDVTQPADRVRFEALVAGADVVLHGLRPGALEGLGYDSDALAAMRPGLIDASLSAWGAGGPWQGRRGFDSLVQMASGIAHAGMVATAGADRPSPLPLQLLDHATAYLLAGGVIRALEQRMTVGRAWRVRVSLARTAAWLLDLPRTGDPDVAEPDADAAARWCDTMDTPWGATTFIRPAGAIVGGPAPAYLSPPPHPGADPPEW